jgi:hypothetical protein
MARVGDKVTFHYIYGSKSLRDDLYVQTMEENPSASRKVMLAHKSTIAVVT